MSLWDQMAGVTCVLHGYPAEGPNPPRVDAAFRLGLTTAELEPIGRWAREKGFAYVNATPADAEDEWRWVEAEAVHVLLLHGIPTHSS